MRIHFGPQRVAVTMRADRVVGPQELIERVRALPPPRWICVSGSFLRLHSDAELFLACEIVAAAHNAGVDPRNEAQRREVEEIERETRERLEAPTDEDEEDDAGDRPPTPSEDMVYEKQVYM